MIIKKGDDGSDIFFIRKGSCLATKTLEAGKPPQDVNGYRKGAYFGEMALMKNEPRAANVIAQTKVKAVSLDRHSFKRLLGPLDSILKRNME